MGKADFKHVASPYYHAHWIDRDKCRGHMACMRHCPTKAIRVRSGKAVINDELCIDCGTCLSVCPEGAVQPISDPVAQLSRFRYKIVVPTAVLYSQFDPSIHPYIIHRAFHQLGFDMVLDVAPMSAMVAAALTKYVKSYSGRLPLISCYCPSVVRLVQVTYPDLVELLVPIDVPREITAREIRRTLPARLEISPEDIGIMYVATCPAKIVSIRQPAEKATSWFDCAVPVHDVYSALLPHVIAIKQEFDEDQIPPGFQFDGDWVLEASLAGGPRTERGLTVSGLDHVRKILDDIENSRLRNVDFVEAHAHMLGCVGGPFNVESPYVARGNNFKRRHRYGHPAALSQDDIAKKMADKFFSFEHPVLPRPTKYFDTDLETSIKRMKERDRVHHKLPQIDCGCCGAPTCLAFAEDLVRGEADLTECLPLSSRSLTP